MHEVKTIYLLYINGTGYMYCDSPDNIDYILSRFRKAENNNILNLHEFKIEVNKILNHSYEYFIFNFDKNILNDISKKVNIIKNDAKPSFREYLGKINNNELVLVIATDYMTYYNHKELENLLSIYSIYDYKKQEEAKIFIKELNRYYYMEGNYYPHKFIFNKTCKEELKCKYCDEKNPLFNYRSHLIPHSIYNNKYFDAQECVSCNQRFGNGIENNSIHFFQQLLKKNINMDSYNINMQDIYRLLVKMSMGFLDISETSLYFKNTIKWIFDLIKLEQLTIDYPIEKLPKDIGNLINLKKLEIYCRKLKEIPNEIKNLINLEDFSIFWNGKSEELPNEILSFKKLNRIYIYSNLGEKYTTKRK